MSVRLRQVAPVAVVLGLTLAGFLAARWAADRGARRDSERRADVAAAQVRGRLAQAASLTASLRRFMLDASGTGVMSDQFARNALRWVTPAGFPAAAWVERVPDSRRAAYQRRLGQPIVTPDDRRTVVPRRASYLPATVVSGFDPLDVTGVDLSGEPGMATALRRATRVSGVVATPVASRRSGTSGLFLVAPAPNLIGGRIHPGAVVLFVPDAALRAAATQAPTARISSGRPHGPDDAASKAFPVAGQQFDVAVPKESVHGAAAVLPWIILGAGLVLAVLAAALGVSAARRARAQDELDRVFRLSPDLITVADFDGHFTRINPAVQQVLGYSAAEFLARPYLDLVHPDDRERTAAEAAAVGEGKTTLSFVNRYLRKDGSYRTLEWTSTPVVKDGLMYGVARDVTERRKSEAEVERLVGEQAALRRVATLVARDAAQAEVFAAIAKEIAQLLGAQEIRMVRYEDDRDAVVVGAWGELEDFFPVGSRRRLGGDGAITRVFRTGQSARIDDYGRVQGPIAESVRSAGLRSIAAAPIVVEGRLWGTMAAGTSSAEPLPAETESRLDQFVELMATAIANTESHDRAQRLAEEQTALRRVATLVARQASQEEVVGAVAREVGGLLGTEDFRILRFEDDETAVMVASSGRGAGHFAAGTRHRLGGQNAVTRVYETRRPVRIDDYGGASGPIGEGVRAVGLRSVVATPITVEGRLWGAMIAGTSGDEPVPPDTEARLGQFTELMATAIANTESYARAERLAEEQAALRRVATLVARGIGPEPVFRAVADEAGALLGCDTAAIVRFEPDGTATMMGAHHALREPGQRFEPDPDYVVAAVRDTGRAARFDTDDPTAADMPEPVRAEGIRSGLASPIVVDGELWGTITVASLQRPVPLRVEQRLADFTELVATAISNAQAREQVTTLADEQAALRRVATLVAREASQGEVFTAIAEEIAQLLGSDEMRMLRYEGDRGALVVASAGHEGAFPVGARQSTEGDTAASRVLRTGHTARIDDYETATGPQADTARSIGIRSAVAAPILVEGRLWGAMVMGTTGDQPLPADTEVRLGQFTALMAAAIANAEARTEADRLAAEQAALRRVATLVAKESPPAEVFATVAEELANVLGDADCSVFRDEGDGTATMVAVSGAALSAGVQVGSRWPLDGTGIIASVLREGRPYRLGDYSAATGAIAEDARERLDIRSAVGCPIVVRGRVWGALAAARYEPHAFPPESERWVAQFAELAATAIVNAEARTEVERLAEEQAALRRVATLVAEGAAQGAVLDAVAAEMERALGADAAMLLRYEPGEEVTVIAGRVPDPRRLPSGTRVSHEGDNVTSMVRRTGRPARIANYERVQSSVADLARAAASGVRLAVGAPIVVDGRIWGVIIASWRDERSPPADTEERMAKFAQLLDTAIANADSRDQLNASRARLLTAGDEARRRVVRDLHDGAQQRLVHTVVTLKLAQRSLREQNGRTDSLIGEALAHAEQCNAELRELAHGILPAVLTRGGLRAGVNSLVARLDLPVQVDVPAERFSAEVEASAYFIVAEALTNVVKHAHASRAAVTASVGDGTLAVAVRDDGTGDADPEGHGLVGLADRATALGGRLDIESPAGGGTLVAATLPLAAG